MSGGCFASHGAVACDGEFLCLVNSTLFFSWNVLMVEIGLSYVTNFFTRHRRYVVMGANRIAPLLDMKVAGHSPTRGLLSKYRDPAFPFRGDI